MTRSWFVGLSLLCLACRHDPDVPRVEVEGLARLTSLLEPLQKELGPVRPGEWLSQHEERGQTFAEYVAEEPVTARGERRVIYVQRIGVFGGTQERITALTAEFLGLYFGLEVQVLEAMPVDESWPAHARRIHPSWGDDQLLSTYVLNDVLRPRLADDAAVLLGLTTMDLWPGRGWNFVFGQASIDRRVGVWSTYRNGDPDESDDAFRLHLRRTLKTATHEAAHAFSLRHCTAFECNLCGSNTREESDRHPLWSCAQCLPKICLATGVDPLERCRALLRFCQREGLAEEASYFARAVALLAS